MKDYKFSTLCFIMAIVGWLSVMIVSPSKAETGESTDQSSATGAKALFYSGEGTSFVASSGPNEPKTKKYAGNSSQKKAPKSRYMGVAYWIDLLTPDGRHMLASKNRVFRSGEKFKLNVKANRPAYLYVINIGSTGRSRVLFPSSNTIDNYVDANTVYSIPGSRYMMFDSNPGEETLLILLSPRPIMDVNQQAPSFDSYQNREVVALAQYRGSKDIVVEDAEMSSSKDIVLEGATAAQWEQAEMPVSSYAVAPLLSLEREGKAVSVFVKLRHE